MIVIVVGQFVAMMFQL